MRSALALALALGGCNAIFGLAPTSLGADGGDGGTVGPDAEGGDAAPASMHGTISATSFGYTQDGSTVQQFLATAEIGHRSACQSTAAGACAVVSCAQVGDPGPWPDTGTIEVIGGNSVSLVPATDGSYAAQSSNVMRLFLDGVSVEIGSTGGEVPAFDVVFAAPHTIDFTSGSVPDSSTPVTLDRAQDHAYAWTGGASTEYVHFVITASDGTVLDCPIRNGGGGGTATIPAAGLSLLPAGTATFTATVFSTLHVDTGTYALDLFLNVVAVSPSGDWANGTITLQ